MRRPRLPIGVSVAASALALACNALTGVGDLRAGACTDCIEANDAQTADVAERVDGSGPTDAPAPDTTIDAGDGPPSFCQGLVLYAPFDGDFATAQGGAPDLLPANPFSLGKYGKGVVSTGTSGAIFYPEGKGGVVYPKDAGTMAVWFKPTWSFPQASDRIFFKPVADRTTGLNGSGPHLRYENAGTLFGMIDQNADASLTSAASTAAELMPYWNDLGWNHLVGTWNKPKPSLTFTLNGATGDASITRRATNAPWAPQFPNVQFTRLGSNANPSDGTFDEMAMWSRELSLAEIQAVYGAKQSIGAACGL